MRTVKLLVLNFEGRWVTWQEQPVVAFRRAGWITRVAGDAYRAGFDAVRLQIEERPPRRRVAGAQPELRPVRLMGRRRRR